MATTAGASHVVRTSHLFVFERCLGPRSVSNAVARMQRLDVLEFTMPTTQDQIEPVEVDHAVGATHPDEDQLQRSLQAAIRLAVRILSILMTAVILWGVADVAFVLYQKLVAPPVGLLSITDILATFGAFMAVLIAIEIFVNINLYLRDDVIHVRIVMATALMAAARKVIVLDFSVISANLVWALAAVVIATSVGYWLVGVATGGTIGIGNSRPPKPKGDES